MTGTLSEAISDEIRTLMSDVANRIVQKLWSYCNVLCDDGLSFVDCYRPEDRHHRKATWSAETPEGRWRPYTYEEILGRDKV